MILRKYGMNILSSVLRVQVITCERKVLFHKGMSYIKTSGAQHDAKHALRIQKFFVSQLLPD
jgi:hypothetical protein